MSIHTSVILEKGNLVEQTLWVGLSTSDVLCVVLKPSYSCTEDLEKALREEFEFSSSTKCRVCILQSYNKYKPLADTSQTLLDAGLYSDQVCNFAGLHFRGGGGGFAPVKFMSR